MPRLFFTTDVHGSDKCFRKFLNAAKVYKADRLILGGDITGKVLIPIVERADGKFDVALFGEEKSVSAERVPEVRKAMQDSGQYSFVTTPTELAEIKADKSKEEAAFVGAMVAVLEGWVKLAHERLEGSGVMCYLSPGNDDKLDIDRALVDDGPVINPENRAMDLGDGFEMITLGYANPTPWHSPREVSEEKLGEMMESLASQVKRPETAVYNLHVPPIDTVLDKAPAVSHDFNYIREGLGIKFVHAGSSAVRKTIERNGPLLGLHGHIHESRGFTKLGRTLCLNPGSEYADGILRGVLANLEDGKLHDYMLTSG